jgi:protein ImuB
LSFVLTRLLEPLATRLERRDRGVAVLHVELGLVTRETHACRLELPSPLRDVRALRTLALLDLESHPPAGAIDRVTVTIEPTPGRILQHALFARPHPTPEQLSTLVARLQALLGQGRVGAPQVAETHRPGAVTLASFALEHDGRGAMSHSDERGASAARQTALSALRRCRQPIPARVTADAARRPLRVTTDRRGFGGGAVLSCAGPWRTSGAWWEAEDTSRAPREAAGPWSRDEWDVALADGAVYRVFRDRTTDGWFIEGVLD